MQLLSLWTNSNKAKIFPSATLVKIEKTKTQAELIKSLKGSENRFIRNVVKDMQDFGEGHWFTISVTEKQSKHFVFFVDSTMTMAAVRLRKSHEGKIGYYDFILDVSVGGQADNQVFNFFLNEMTVDAELENISPVVDVLVDTKDELAEALAIIEAQKKQIAELQAKLEKANGTIEFHRSKHRTERKLIETLGEEKAEQVISIEAELNELADVSIESEIELVHSGIDIRLELNEKPSISRAELHNLSIENPIKFAITKKKINDGEIDLKDF